MAEPGFDAKLETDETSATAGSETEYPGTTSLSVNVSQNTVEVSELGDAGMRQIVGRADFSVDADFNVDLTQSKQQDMILNVRDGDTMYTKVLPDRDTTANYLDASCKVSSISFDVPGDSEATATATLENANGSTWSWNT